MNHISKNLQIKLLIEKAKYHARISRAYLDAAYKAGGRYSLSSGDAYAYSKNYIDSLEYVK